jgi:hypothetical protein
MRWIGKNNDDNNNNENKIKYKRSSVHTPHTHSKIDILLPFHATLACVIIDMRPYTLQTVPAHSSYNIPTDIPTAKRKKRDKNDRYVYARGL